MLGHYLTHDGAMPAWLRDVLDRGLPPISGGDDEPPPDDKKTDDTTDDEPTPEGLGDAGKKALEAERQKRRDAAKRAKAAEDELTTLRAEKAAADAAKAKADEEDARKRGEFEQLAAKREQERDAATAERDALKARLERIDADRTAAIEDGIKEFPKDLPALAFDPGADADLDARWDWFVKAAKQAGSEAKEPTQTPRLPRNSDRTGPTDADRAKFARRYE